MKKLTILLLFTGITLLANAQQSIENRMQEMYTALTNNKFDDYVKKYMYGEVFDIVPADTLTSILKGMYDSEMYKMKITSSDLGNISKIITHNGIQYAHVKNKSRIEFHLKRDYFVKDSIETAHRYDSLRAAMAVDTEYQAFLKIYESEDYEFSEDGKGYWDYPYYELPDSTYISSTVDESMQLTLNRLLIGMVIGMDKKTMKKIKYDMDEEKMVFTVDNYTENGTIAFLNPKYGPEWQFIANNPSNPMIINYLVPIEVRKKLKL